MAAQRLQMALRATWASRTLAQLRVEPVVARVAFALVQLVLATDMKYHFEHVTKFKTTLGADLLFVVAGSTVDGNMIPQLVFAVDIIEVMPLRRRRAHSFVYRV